MKNSIFSLLPADWMEVLKEDLCGAKMAKIQRDFEDLASFYPPKNLIFNALKLTPFARIKAVILGQDPYHGGEAMGLAFGVRADAKIPPSLKNIFKECGRDLDGWQRPKNGDLSSWAKSGVLLLNAALTVAPRTPASHSFWRPFTDLIIAKIAAKEQKTAFLLWGKAAQKKAAIITQNAPDNRHLILTAPHPSPLARGGFAGCSHFSKCNDFLVKNGISPIDWGLPADEEGLF